MKHEYVNGHVEAMKGAHNLLAAKIAWLFIDHLKDSECTTFISDMKVRIKTLNDDKFYYPDVMVSCDKNPKSEYYEENPVLIVEVLSDSTAMRDKLEKRDAYSKLNTLVEYMMVAQDRAEIEVVIFGDERISSVNNSEGETIHLRSIGLSLAVDDVYESLLN